MTFQMNEDVKTLVLVDKQKGYQTYIVSPFTAMVTTRNFEKFQRFNYPKAQQLFHSEGVELILFENVLEIRED